MEINHPNRVICPRCGDPGTKQAKMIKCKNPKCSKCPHGPYYYVAHRVDGKRKNCYIGKNWPSSEMKNEPTDQWHKIKKFLMNKLEDFGCPDSMVEPTAEKMTDKIKMILEEEV